MGVPPDAKSFNQARQVGADADGVSALAVK